MSSKYHLVRTLAFLRVMALAFLLFLLLMPQESGDRHTQQSTYTVSMYGQPVGVTDSREKVYACYRQARLQTADSDRMVLMDYPDIEITAEKEYRKTDTVQQITENMLQAMAGHEVRTLEKAYSIKVNGQLVNVAGIEQVKALFEETISRYDTENTFDVELLQDNSREFNILTPSIIPRSESASGKETSPLPTGGLESLWAKLETADQPEKTGFDAYEPGIKAMKFSAPIEIVSAYLPASEIMEEEAARLLLTENQDTSQIYKVQSGDTLSEISLKTGLPLARIIELNEELEDENSNIYVDQELIVTVPQPKLAVIWTVQKKISESYEPEVEYIYNDSWYTNKSVTLQQPSAGYREAIANVTYENDTQTAQEILYEKVYEEAVAKVIEVGTLVPPTYIKPIAGGRMTSSFGRRKAPTKGASTYHKGIDWATPVGTPVYASSGGVVTRAGWGSGYGYVVFINHPDGKQTRYGHLSKVRVSVGQTVKQGQVIASSGNTGRSTGPHLHFEILVGGSAVNPLNYLN